MGLVSAKGILEKALEGHYAVGAFNINNLEWTKAILLEAEELRSPVILEVSEGANKYMTGYKTVAAMVSAMVDSMGITVPVALHLDHGTYEGAKACIEAGYTSVMFDGSHLPFDENVAKTKEIVALAHKHGVSVEAEAASSGLSFASIAFITASASTASPTVGTISPPALLMESPLSRSILSSAPLTS